RIGCLHEVLPRRERSRGQPGAPWAERARPRYADLGWHGLHAQLKASTAIARLGIVRLRPMHGRRDAGGTDMSIERIGSGPADHAQAPGVGDAGPSAPSEATRLQVLATEHWSLLA